MARLHTRRSAAAAALLLAGLAAGCQSPHAAAPPPPPADEGPLVDADGQPRSLVFAPRDVELAAGLDGEYLPWWAERNDRRASVTVGVELPTVLYSDTVTFDRQSESNGDVRNFGSHRVFRGRTQGGVQ